jgi:hypothetical protein
MGNLLVTLGRLKAVGEGSPKEFGISKRKKVKRSGWQRLLPPECAQLLWFC